MKLLKKKSKYLFDHFFIGEVLCKHLSTSNTMELDRIGARPVGSTHDNVCPSTTAGKYNIYLSYSPFSEGSKKP